MRASIIYLCARFLFLEISLIREIILFNLVSMQIDNVILFTIYYRFYFIVRSNFLVIYKNMKKYGHFCIYHTKKINTCYK